MELTNEFHVSVPVAETWRVLTDLERIAPCLPGAQLQEVEGDEYRGVVKVKVGPITAQYKGKAVFVEQDEQAGRAVLRAEGRDTRGQGNASATITANMTPDGDRTKVTVVTDLTVTGKVAQFGRGVLGDVSAKLLTQFAEALEADIATTGTSPSAEPSTPIAAQSAASESATSSAKSVPAEGASAGVGAAAADATAAGPPEAGTPEATAPQASAPEAGPTDNGVRRIDSPEATPIDLVQTAGGSFAKRVVPTVGVLAVLLVLLSWLRRRQS